MTDKQSQIRKTILITGAFGGIGRAIAIQLAQPGHILLLNGRAIEKLNEVKTKAETLGAQAYILQADLSDAAEREKFIHEVLKICTCPDVIIINAGFGWFGYFHEMPLETAGAMNRLMIDALIEIDRTFLPMMMKRHTGHILHIGSMVGSMPNGGIAMYSAIKGYMDNFCTSLYRETRGSGVHISVIRPGPVKSDFFDHAKAQEHGGTIPGERMAVSPERVAKAVEQLIRHPRRLRYVPAYYWITQFWEPFMGRFVDLLGPLLLKHPS